MCVLLCIIHYFIMLGLIIYLMYHMSYILRPVPEGSATEEAANLARGLWSLSSWLVHPLFLIGGYLDQIMLIWNHWVQTEWTWMSDLFGGWPNKSDIHVHFVWTRRVAKQIGHPCPLFEPNGSKLTWFDAVWLCGGYGYLFPFTPHDECYVGPSRCCLTWQSWGRCLTETEEFV